MWIESVSSEAHPRLEGRRTTEVAVVGGGIAGLTTAVELAEAGVDVAVLEADRIGTGEGATQRSTAKVTALHGLRYGDIREQFGTAGARRYADANQTAVEAVADRCESTDVDVGFDRRPSYTYVRDDRDRIEAEVETASALGLDAAFVEDVPLPVDAAGAIRLDGQGQFHPARYLQGLAAAVEAAGGTIFEESPATGIERTSGTGPRAGTDRGGGWRVEADGGAVSAEQVVVATRFPFFDRGGYFARMAPRRSYLVAVRVSGDLPEGMYYRQSDPYRSVSSHTNDGEELALVGGENHQTGQDGDTEVHYRRLEEFARDLFDVEEFAYRWSTQDYTPVDTVPFVGRIGPGIEDVYVATGFGGWGMTNGTAAGLMLADTIRGEENDWLETFSPMRLTGADSTLGYNLETGTKAAGGWLCAMLDGSDRPAPGEGAVSREGARPVARYRDDDGEVHAVSAVCSHMGCIVEWNSAEESWDCPCHGSRFAPTGEVLEGPSQEGLSDLDHRE